MNLDKRVTKHTKKQPQPQVDSKGQNTHNTGHKASNGVLHTGTILVHFPHIDPYPKSHAFSNLPSLGSLCLPPLRLEIHIGPNEVGLRQRIKRHP